MIVPQNLFYTSSHQWVQFLSATTAYVGLTDFAQEAMGEIFGISLPHPGDAADKGEVFADVDAAKGFWELGCPVSGEVSAINEELLVSPELVNTEPYGAWLAEICDIVDRDELLDSADYEALCAEAE